MKITSDGRLELSWFDVDELRVKLNSTDSKMRLLMKSLNCAPPKNYISKEDDLVTIEFSDSWELDVFIEALTKFRDLNRAAMGKWQVTLDDVRGGFQ